jgi:hypothetical protein
VRENARTIFSFYLARNILTPHAVLDSLFASQFHLWQINKQNQPEWRAKRITPEKAAAIRNKYESNINETRMSLAAVYNVHPDTIAAVIQNRVCPDSNYTPTKERNLKRKQYRKAVSQFFAVLNGASFLKDSARQQNTMGVSI